MQFLFGSEFEAPLLAFRDYIKLGVACFFENKKRQASACLNEMN